LTVDGTNVANNTHVANSPLVYRCPPYLRFFIQVAGSQIEGEAVKHATCIPNKKC
jgi:hypothetical protein